MWEMWKKMWREHAGNIERKSGKCGGETWENVGKWRNRRKCGGKRWEIWREKVENVEGKKRQMWREKVEEKHSD